MVGDSRGRLRMRHPQQRLGGNYPAGGCSHFGTRAARVYRHRVQRVVADYGGHSGRGSTVVCLSGGDQWCALMVDLY